MTKKKPSFNKAAGKASTPATTKLAPEVERQGNERKIAEHRIAHLAPTAAALAPNAFREFLATCAEGDLDTVWTRDANLAHEAAIAHQNIPGNETHIVTVLVRQTG